MRILGFAGSNSSNSINKKLVAYTLSFFAPNEEELLDLNDYEMQIFSKDREKATGIPSKAYEFAQKIDQSDLLIISLAENNGAYSAAFKNIFDWVSRIKGRTVFAEKPILLMASSTGKRGGNTVLEIAKNRFPYNGGKVLATFSLPNFMDNFDDEHGIINEEMNYELMETIAKVKKEWLTVIK